MESQRLLDLRSTVLVDYPTLPRRRRYPQMVDSVSGKVCSLLADWHFCHWPNSLLRLLLGSTSIWRVPWIHCILHFGVWRLWLIRNHQALASVSYENRSTTLDHLFVPAGILLYWGSACSCTIPYSDFHGFSLGLRLVEMVQTGLWLSSLYTNPQEICMMLLSSLIFLLTRCKLPRGAVY